MEITHEILAAYAEGKLPENMLPEVRQYLAAHPEELDQVLLLMDTQHPIEETMEENLFVASGAALGASSLLSMSAAAFIPPAKRKKGTPSVRKMNIQSNLTNLLNDLI